MGGKLGVTLADRCWLGECKTERGFCGESGARDDLGLCLDNALLIVRGVDWVELDWLLAPLLSALANREPMLSHELKILSAAPDGSSVLVVVGEGSPVVAIGFCLSCLLV